MNHSFNVEVASELGVNEAILLENLRFWCDKNRANKKNIHDGLSWTYNSIKAFVDLFPYLSENKIRSALNKLEKEGYIKTGNFNKMKYDRTKWYAVTEKGYVILGESICENYKMENIENQNGNDDNNEPIPDINTDIKPDINKDKDPSPQQRIEEYTNNEDLRTALNEFISMRKKKKNKITDYGLTKALNKLDSMASSDAEKIKIVDNSVIGGWLSFYPLKQDEKKELINEHDYSEYL